MVMMGNSRVTGWCMCICFSVCSCLGGRGGEGGFLLIIMLVPVMRLHLNETYKLTLCCSALLQPLVAMVMTESCEFCVLSVFGFQEADQVHTRTWEMVLGLSPDLTTKGS